MKLTEADVEDFSSPHSNLNHRGLSLKKQYLVIKKKTLLDLELDPITLSDQVVAGGNVRYKPLWDALEKHAFGIPNTVDDILESCKRHELVLIEAGISCVLAPPGAAYAVPNKPTLSSVVLRWPAMDPHSSIEALARKIFQGRMEKYDIVIDRRLAAQFRFYESTDVTYLEVHYPIVAESMSLKLGARR